MNHDLYFETITPRIARNIMRIRDTVNIEIDPQIPNIAAQDRTHDDELAQFIDDMNHRCVISYRDAEDARNIRNTIAGMIRDHPRILIADSPLLWNRLLGERLISFVTKSGERYQFTNRLVPNDLVRDRDMTVVMHVQSTVGLTKLQVLGKIFPKLIMIAQDIPDRTPNTLMRKNNIPISCAEILDSVISTDLSRMHPELYPLRGIYRYSKSETA